jgi:hypothetical protein
MAMIIECLHLHIKAIDVFGDFTVIHQSCVTCGAHYFGDRWISAGEWAVVVLKGLPAFERGGKGGVAGSPVKTSIGSSYTKGMPLALTAQLCNEKRPV